MAIWRPAPEIRVKVIGLVRRESRLLVAVVENDAGRVKGFRPLGGTVEFGETRDQALRREFREELGCDIQRTGDWIALENIFEHEGRPGHEVIFAAFADVTDPVLLARDEIAFREADGTGCLALWIDPAALPPGTSLYPDGLTERLGEAERAGEAAVRSFDGKRGGPVARPAPRSKSAADQLAIDAAFSPSRPSAFIEARNTSVLST